MNMPTTFIGYVATSVLHQMKQVDAKTIRIVSSEDFIELFKANDKICITEECDLDYCDSAFVSLNVLFNSLNNLNGDLKKLFLRILNQCKIGSALYFYGNKDFIGEAKLLTDLLRKYTAEQSYFEIKIKPNMGGNYTLDGHTISTICLERTK